jgi:hypothetical protein
MVDVLVITLLFGVATIAVFSYWDAVNFPSRSVFDARANLILTGVTSAAVGIAAWSGWLTRRLAIIGQEQLADSRKESIQQNKPIVFADRREDLTNEGDYHYFIRNVGGGFAVNVYCLYEDDPQAHPTPLGSLRPGEERPFPYRFDRALCEASAGAPFVLIAEGPFSRTTQWTPTLNWRTDHTNIVLGDGQVHHRLAGVKVPPPRFKDQSLGAFLEGNMVALQSQLRAFVNEQQYGSIASETTDAAAE